MARPAKEITDHRIKIAQTRLTQNEMKILEEMAFVSGLNISDFMRVKILGAKPRRAKVTPEQIEFIKALGQLGHIRSDLNQLLKDRWSYRFVQPHQIQTIVSAIETIANAIHSNLKSDGDQRT